MNKHTEAQLKDFMTILKTLNVEKKQIIGICSMMKNEEMVLEIVKRLKKENFQLTPQETVNICSQVIKENQ